MRFHYVPSTYRGRKFGKGFCGGAYRGCARICGGSLDDNVEDTPGPVAVPVNIPVEPAQIQQNLLDFPNITPEMIERARTIIALAEATGKAQPITKKEAGIWSGIKNIGSKIWSGAKAVASNPLVQTAAGIAAPYLIGAVAPTLASYVPKALDSVGRYAYNKLDPIYHQEAIVNKSAGDNFQEIKDNLSELASKGVANTASAVAAAPAAIYNSAANILKSGWNRFWNKSGSGYRGGRRARFRKGSPEAKAYMARLRAMRGRKKKSGHGYRGGMLHPGLLRMPMPNLYKNFRGSGYRGGMFRGVAYNDLVKLADDAEAKGENFVDVKWKDAFGNERTTKVSVANIDKMLHATDTIADFYDNNEDRSKYIEDHYGEKAWPYQKMTYKRYKKMLSTHRRTQNKWKDVQKYWNDRTENGTSDFYKKWLAFNYYQPDAEENEFSIQNVRTKNAKKMRNIISQTRLIRKKKEGLISDPELAARIPKFFTRIYTSSKIKTEPYKYIYPKRKKKIPVSDDALDPLLSPVAAATAASTSVNGSAAPPPASILPVNDNGEDDDDTETETDDDNVPAEIASLRKKLDRELERASGIKNNSLRDQVMTELANLGNNDLANIVDLYNNGGSWKAPATRLRKKLNKITSRITGGLKKQ